MALNWYTQPQIKLFLIRLWKRLVRLVRTGMDWCKDCSRTSVAVSSMFMAHTLHTCVYTFEKDSAMYMYVGSKWLRWLHLYTSQIKLYLLFESTNKNWLRLVKTGLMFRLLSYDAVSSMFWFITRIVFINTFEKDSAMHVGSKWL